MCIVAIDGENQVPHRLVLLGEACPTVEGVDVGVGRIGLPIEISVKRCSVNAIGPYRDDARPGASSHRSRGAHRYRRAARDGADLPQRFAGPEIRGTAARPWHAAFGRQAPKIIPYERELRQAADVLNAGEKVAIPGRRRRAQSDR